MGSRISYAVGCVWYSDEWTRPGEATSPRPPTGARRDGSDVLLTFSMVTVSPVIVEE